MNSPKRTKWARLIFMVLTVGLLGMYLMPRASAYDRDDIKNVQARLQEKGYYHGVCDGIMGPQTRAAIRQYQQSENLEATGDLDEGTAGKLGVGPESTRGRMKGAGHDVVEGGKEFGHDMKGGHPVAAGKDLGKGVVHGGENAGKGVKNGVSPDKDHTNNYESPERQR